MAMSTGGKGGPTSEINMTPMIDVMLVLLIIFMVVQQGLQKGLSVQVPPIDTESTANPDLDQIVLEIKPGPEYFINQQPVSAANLEAELQRVFAGRPRKVIFVKGEEDINYGDVIHVVDATRVAGVEVVGLVPRT